MGSTSLKGDCITWHSGPSGTRGGRAVTQLLAGDWSGGPVGSLPRLGWRSILPANSSLPKLIHKGRWGAGRGGAGGPVWLSLYPVSTQCHRESRGAEAGLAAGPASGDGGRALEAQFWAGGDGGTRREGTGLPDTVTGLFRNRRLWPREELCFRRKEQHVPRCVWGGMKLDRSLGLKGWGSSSTGLKAKTAGQSEELRPRSVASGEPAVSLRGSLELPASEPQAMASGWFSPVPTLEGLGRTLSCSACPAVCSVGPSVGLHPWNCRLGSRTWHRLRTKRDTWTELAGGGFRDSGLIGGAKSI